MIRSDIKTYCQQELVVKEQPTTYKRAYTYARVHNPLVSECSQLSDKPQDSPGVSCKCTAPRSLPWCRALRNTALSGVHTRGQCCFLLFEFVHAGSTLRGNFTERRNMDVKPYIRVVPKNRKFQVLTGYPLKMCDHIREGHTPILNIFFKHQF